MSRLHWNTVNRPLREVLEFTMQNTMFDSFRLVGGTALSLQLGHRISVDIDLFTDVNYGTIDFELIDDVLRNKFKYVFANKGTIGIGTSYIVGRSEQEAIKMDLYYTDPFIQPFLEENGIRLATVEEILAMKVDVISRGGRKKDFWDIHFCT